MRKYESKIQLILHFLYGAKRYFVFSLTFAALVSLFDMLNQGSRFADAMNKLASVPGIEQLLAMAGTIKQKAARDDDREEEEARERA